MNRYAYETKSLDPVEANEHDNDNNIDVDAALETLTATATATFKKQDAAIGRLADGLAKMESKMNRPGAFTGSGMGAANDNKSTIEVERKNVNHFIRGQFKSLTVGIDPQAGYFVPEILQPTMTEKLYDTPTLLGLVRNERWDGPGSEWIEPLKRALLTARRRGSETEAAQDTGTTAPIGLLSVPAGEAEASVTLSQKLIDDSARDLSVMVVSDMQASFDRQIDAEIVNGTGIGEQAQGFLSVPAVTTDDTTRPWGSLQYVPSTSATLVTADSLFDLMYTLRAPYRNGATFVMCSNTANAVDKLKDGNGDYVWRNSMQSGTPPTLLGFPVAFDENMPVIAANAFPIAFGNFRMAFLVATKNQMMLIRDQLTAKPNTVLYGYKRQGGGVANSEALKLLKIATS